MQALQLKDWDPEDLSLVNANGKFTASGFIKYWQCIDDAFESWDREQMRQQHSGISQNRLSAGKGKKQEKSFFREKVQNDDKIKWKPEKTRFSLPVLPKSALPPPKKN